MSPSMGLHHREMDTSVHHMRVESSREPSIAASPPPIHHLFGATGRPPPPLPPPRFPNSAVWQWETLNIGSLAVRAHLPLLPLLAAPGLAIEARLATLIVTRGKACAAYLRHSFKRAQRWARLQISSAPRRPLGCLHNNTQMQPDISSNTHDIILHRTSDGFFSPRTITSIVVEYQVNSLVNKLQ